MDKRIRRRMLRLLVGTRRVAMFSLSLGFLFVGVGTNWPSFAAQWKNPGGVTLIQCMDKYAKFGMTAFCIGLAGIIVPIAFGSQYRGYRKLYDKGLLSKREYEQARRAILEAELSSLKDHGAS